MFTTIVDAYIRNLTNLKAILGKAKIWQDEHKVSDETLLGARLTLDQFPLVRQIQIATDHAKKGAAVLCGVEAPVFEDTEKTLEEVFARIDKTIVFLATLSEEMVISDLTTAKKIPFAWIPGKGFTAQYYVETYTHENFYFHYTTAYSIVRHYGVGIGKGDYMAGVEFVDLA